MSIPVKFGLAFFALGILLLAAIMVIVAAADVSAMFGGKP
jgi:CDP-diglyceride synthetase